MTNDAITIRTLQEPDTERWDAFVRASAQGSFFHLSAWRTLIEQIQRHKTYYLYAERAGEMLAVLPLAQVKSRLFGHSLCSLPFVVIGGIVGEDAAARQALEHHADELARKLGVSHLEYRNATAQHADWPAQDLYVNFRKALPHDEEAIMASIPRKQRAMVRKGIKNNLLAQIDQNVDRFFAVFSENVKRHGTPALPKRWFAALKETFGQDCEVLTVTDSAGNVLSSVMSFYFQGEVLAYYAGDNEAARDLAANDFKYWRLMCQAASRGCTVFDYGRSKVGTGPYHFKKNWGFEPEPLSYEYVLYKTDSIPQNNPMNPKYRVFIALWRRLPLCVANAIGPHIVRNLG